MTLLENKNESLVSYNVAVGVKDSRNLLSSQATSMCHFEILPQTESYKWPKQSVCEKTIYIRKYSTVALYNSVDSISETKGIAGERILAYSLTALYLAVIF